MEARICEIIDTIEADEKRKGLERMPAHTPLRDVCAEPQVDIRKRHKRESDVRGERADMSDRHATHICCFREVG